MCHFPLAPGQHYPQVVRAAGILGTHTGEKLREVRPARETLAQALPQGGPCGLKSEDRRNSAVILEDPNLLERVRVVWEGGFLS